MAGCEGGCGRAGVCNMWSGVCDCPMGWEGSRCERSLLPSCVLPGGEHIPIRSWALHAFHNGAARGRWGPPRRNDAIGPVPCECLQEWVVSPWLLERTRLQGMRGWTVRCISLGEMSPPAGDPGAASAWRGTLVHALESPNRSVWRSFNFSAAHEALVLGQTPRLDGGAMDQDRPDVAARLAPLRARAERITAALQGRPVLDTPVLRSEAPRLLLPHTPQPLPLLPLAHCPGRCSGRGWCEPTGTARRMLTGEVRRRAAMAGTPRCGCFVANGLLAGGFGGPECAVTRPARLGPGGLAHPAAVGESPYWGPACPDGCSLHGECDWQGFCRCEQGFWGLDCALRLGPGGRPEVASRQQPSSGLARRAGDSRVASSPRIYVLDLPPHLRFGVGFAAAFEARLHERFLRSSQRTADMWRADFVFIPGPPLVVDGHRLLARLWFARQRSLLWLHGTAAENRRTAAAQAATQNITAETSAGENLVGVRASRGAALGTYGKGSSPVGARHIICLFTERAAMDSFQLSYSEADREEWPGLATAPHVLGIRAEWRRWRESSLGGAPRTRAAGRQQEDPRRNGVAWPTGGMVGRSRELECGLADPPAPAPLDHAEAGVLLDRMLSQAEALAGGAGGDGDAGGGSGGAGGDDSAAAARLRALAQLRVLVADATEWRLNTIGHPLLRGLFARGAMKPTMALARRGCQLPDDLRPDSRSRRWLGLQFNGNTVPPVSFARGVDVVIPQLLLLAKGGSHADQPSCDTMRASSPHSPAFERRDLHRRRSTLLWFGGHPGHGGARTQLFRLFGGRGHAGGAAAPGFRLVDSLAGGARRDAVNMSLRSLFCWVPRGQGEGDPTRHMVALFHGCVPIFTLGKEGADDALPFEELIDWGQLSIRVPTDRLDAMSRTLWRVAADGPRLQAMQRRLGCAWRQLFWSSLEGSCFGEPIDDGNDAFGALLAVLRRRLRPPGARWRAHALGGDGGCDGVPPAASTVEPAPGADPELLSLRPKTSDGQMVNTINHSSDSG